VQLRRRARHLSLLGALLRHRYDAPGRRAPRRAGSGACGVEAVRAGASAAWPRLPARRTAVSLARARARGGPAARGEVGQARQAALETARGRVKPRAAGVPRRRRVRHGLSPVAARTRCGPSALPPLSAAVARAVFLSLAMSGGRQTGGGGGRWGFRPQRGEASVQRLERQRSSGWNLQPRLRCSSVPTDHARSRIFLPFSNISAIEHVGGQHVGVEF
jgi:hypothetical protein